jgi:hypothetical protein
MLPFTHMERGHNWPLTDCFSDWNAWSSTVPALPGLVTSDDTNLDGWQDFKFTANPDEAE